MKPKPILIGLTCAAMATLLFLAACSSGVSVNSLNIACDDFYQQPHITREVTVAAGDSFTVTLCSNPTTGFQWSETVQISDQDVLKQASHQFVAPEAKGGRPPAPGTAGEEVWTFEALKKGASTVSLEYSRPWEGGEKGEWTFALTVIVK